jgi:hypothetical protein
LPLARSSAFFLRRLTAMRSTTPCAVFSSLKKVSAPGDFPSACRN